MRSGQHRRLGGKRRILLVDNLAIVHDDNPITDQGDLRKLAGVEQDRRAIGG